MITSQLLEGQSTSASLGLALFGADSEQVHEPWRKLFASDAFAFREGLTHRERTALSYERLRLVNAAVGDPRALVNDTTALTALHAWAGVVDAGMATLLSIHYNLFLGSLLDHDHAERDLTPYFRDRVGTFLCTEQAHGNDASQLETTAVLDRVSGGFRLDTPNPGACKWMPNTSSIGGAKDAVVAARLLIDGTDEGVFLFLVPLSDQDGNHLPGVEVRQLPETASSPVDHCATSFHDVRLPITALLQGDHGRLGPDGRLISSLKAHRKRFLQSIGRVTAGKLCMSAYSLGVTRHALRAALGYADQRYTSGMTKGQRVPLLAYRSHHAPLLAGLATTYAATMLHRSTVRRWDQASAEDREDCERLTAMVKGWVTWQARAVMTECRERCGAQGLALANNIAGQLAANEGTITAEGDNLVIWVKAAGEMVMGFTAAKASEIPPAERSLRDPRHLQDLLADVERIWQQRASTRLRRPATSPLARWNSAVTPALKLVEAHAQRLAGEELHRAATQAAPALTRQLLGDLHGLFALRAITDHSGDLLAAGRLTADQLQELPDAIDDVIADLAPHALTLADGFAVPDELLRSPMLQPTYLGTDLSDGQEYIARSEA